MSSRALSAHPLSASDEGRWAALTAGHGTIFNTIEWTSLFGPNLQRIGLYDAGGDLRGGFCVWQQRKYGLRVLRNPPFTPHIGPFYAPKAINVSARSDEQRAVLEAMAEYLSQRTAAVFRLNLSLGINDCLPFYWRGWKVVPHYTYRINLTQDENALWEALSKERRNDVRKAQKDKLIAEKTADTGAMRALVTETYARHDKSFPRTAMANILSNWPPGENSYCYLSWLDGRPIACVYVVHDSHTAYYLMGGYSEGAHHGAGALAMWHAILRAKELGMRVFDFEGSNVPSIERYFRGFGGTLTPYIGVHKAWLPVEMALKLRYRNLF